MKKNNIVECTHGDGLFEFKDISEELLDMPALIDSVSEDGCLDVDTFITNLIMDTQNEGEKYDALEIVDVVNLHTDIFDKTIKINIIKNNSILAEYFIKYLA